MAENYKEKFQYNECETLYEENWDAQTCCEPERIYECEICEEIHYSESNAKRCCVEDEEGEPQISKKYLEAHGQERLFNL